MNGNLAISHFKRYLIVFKMRSIITIEQSLFEIEVNSGYIFTKPRKRRGKYSQSHYSPRLIKEIYKEILNMYKATVS